MKPTFLNRKEAQQRAGVAVKQEGGHSNKIKLADSAIGVAKGTTGASLNEKKMEKLKNDKIIMNE